MESLSALSKLVRSEDWNALREVLAPEVHQLINEWDSLPSGKKAELAGFALGSHGSDIFIPGALTKAVAKGLKGAQELSRIYKGLQTAEQTLLLESVAGLESGAKIGEVIQTTQKTITLGEELGYSVREMAQLKQAGKLETTVSNTLENISKNPVTRESFELFYKAQEFLKPYEEFMPEVQCKELIHKTGVSTFSKPTGIPENFRVRISDKGAGLIYMHPEHTHTSIRIMPGKSYSPLPYQQKPYVIHMKDGKALDKFGNKLSSKEVPEAHIPYDEFVYRD